MQPCAVAPFAGAWIEILFSNPFFILNNVAPFAGAWIEITDRKAAFHTSAVAPFAGAWIEILMSLSLKV